MDELQLAGCIFLDKQGRVLLIHRHTDKYDHWEVPGGKVEPGESTAVAAVREVREELGGASFVDGRAMHYHWFLAETSDVPKICEPDTFEGLAYFTTDELANGDLSLSEGAKCFVSLVKTEEIKL